jgi:hypothetical protein
MRDGRQDKKYNQLEKEYHRLHIHTQQHHSQADNLLIFEQ